MKHNYSAVLNAIKSIVKDNIIFVSEAAEVYAEDFAITLRATDNFHPFDYQSEVDLCRALEGMPERCNYRNLESYWAWKNGREYLSWSILDYVNDMYDLIIDYYYNPWNFAPGYTAPTHITYKTNWDTVITKKFRNIMRAARV